jgi:hypothetical protein
MRNGGEYFCENIYKIYLDELSENNLEWFGGIILAGLIYVVHNEWIRNPKTNEMPYKVGITSQTVEDRYYGLGLKMPGEFKCDIAYEFEDYSTIETILHGILNQLCVGGEWFTLNEKAFLSLKEVCEKMGGKKITQESIEEEIIEEETLGFKEWMKQYRIKLGYDENGNQIITNIPENFRTEWELAPTEIRNNDENKLKWHKTIIHVIGGMHIGINQNNEKLYDINQHFKNGETVLEKCLKIKNM